MAEKNKNNKDSQKGQVTPKNYFKKQLNDYLKIRKKGLKTFLTKLTLIRTKNTRQ
jgi:hypothetical protein